MGEGQEISSCKKAGKFSPQAEPSLTLGNSSQRGGGKGEENSSLGYSDLPEGLGKGGS